jgi:hypothetical protein
MRLFVQADKQISEQKRRSHGKVKSRIVADCSSGLVKGVA